MFSSVYLSFFRKNGFVGSVYSWEAVVAQVSRHIHCLTQQCLITALSMASCMACYLPPYHLLLGYCVADALFLHNRRIDLIASIFECKASFFPAFLFIFRGIFTQRLLPLANLCVCLCINLWPPLMRSIDLNSSWNNLNMLTTRR